MPCIETGVAVGCYGWPSLAELQILTVKQTCGKDTPILVVDDQSPRRAEIITLCKRHGADFVDAGHVHPEQSYAERVGHTGGDLAVFWQAVMWGRRKRLKVVAKLSQRFVVTRPNWLQEGAKELLDATAALACKPCRGALHHFDLRTEAALLQVTPWAANPEAMLALQPRPRQAPDVAETLFYRTHKDHVAPYFWPWTLLAENREQPSPDYLWHYANTPDDYHALAARHGITLDPDFTTGGWNEARFEYQY